MWRWLTLGYFLLKTACTLFDPEPEPGVTAVVADAGAGRQASPELPEALPPVLPDLASGVGPLLQIDPALEEAELSFAPGGALEPDELAEGPEDTLEPDEPAGEPEGSLGLGLHLEDDLALEPDGGVGSPTEPMSGSESEPIVFEPGVRSLRVKRSIVLRAEPRRNAAPIGTLAQDMRVEWKQVTKGPGCDAWVEVVPRGWVCNRYLEASEREPHVHELPALAPGAITPGLYARVVGRWARAYPTRSDARWRRNGRRLRGSITVQLASEVRLGGRRYWRTSDGEYILARYLRTYEPSSFVGVDHTVLDAVPLPLAWAQSRTAPREPVVVRVAPWVSAAQETVLPPRTVVAVREFTSDGAWARIAEEQWVAAVDLHVARPMSPPVGVGPEERWLDVDLSEQVLVAYEGERPVYATLISSGAGRFRTPKGLFRIWIKFAEADMAGRVRGSSYRVATVPWTMFFEGNFALHTSYWHDRFGMRMSHGCINLAPQDARALYLWSAPQVPLGWSMVYSTPEHPGSIIRVRGGVRTPAPKLVASRVEEVEDEEPSRPPSPGREEEAAALPAEVIPAGGLREATRPQGGASERERSSQTAPRP